MKSKLLSNTELLSRTITFLRFPLIVGVVFIHTNLLNTNIGGFFLIEKDLFPLHNILRYLISEELARIAVPIFFFISGFLFFYSTNFSFSSYKKKLRKRFYTLLVPYLFWNLIVVVLFLLTETFLSSITSGANTLLTDYTLSDWGKIFWNYKDGMPICYQFWFIRDLIVAVLFSPLIFWYIKRLKIIGIVVLGTLWCFDLWFSIIGFSSTAFFFFSFGAWFSINKRNFAKDFKNLRIPIIFLYIFIISIDIILWYYQINRFHFIHNIGIFVGLITIITWTAYSILKGKIKCNTLLASSSFFIYAYHAMPVAFLSKFWIKLIQPATELTLILGYIFIPFIIVVIGIGVYTLAQKYFPRFTNVIVGGR